MGWEMGRRFRRKGTYVYLWLIPVDVWQKPTQHCKAITLQLKNKKNKFFKESSPAPQFKNIDSSALSLFMIQLSHPYLTTGKTIGLTRRTFVCKVMSLLFNTLSRLVIAFLSWLQSPSSVILEPKKIKSVTVAIVSPSIF